MKVSVIVPVYNSYNYLTKCLDSLVNQKLKDIEIIIVNDGSTDKSLDIINKYLKKYKNMSLYSKENGGLSDARNYGIKRAKGDYIAFLDSDDYIDSNMLKEMVDYAINKDLDIVVCDSINVYNNGKQEYIKSNNHYSDDDIRNYIISPPMACIRLFKRNLFDKIEFKKGIFYEDLELTPRMVKLTKKIGFLEKGFYYYVHREGSIMKQKSFNDKLLDIFTVLEHNKKELIKDYHDEVEYMYITHLLRTASLRFLEYPEGKDLINRIVNIFKNDFQNWRKNKYYKKSSIKLKLICNLAFYKQITMLKLIKKLKNN